MSTILTQKITGRFWRSITPYFPSGNHLIRLQRVVSSDQLACIDQ